MTAQSAVVIGGGIAGLATAALLARDGYATTVVERHDELGGRAGILRDSGFTFDTGPSWYLMPEAFEHFFELCGTTADAELDLTPLDPGYRVFFQDDDEPVDVRPGLEEATALFESLEPGSGPALEKYLDGARDFYDTATQRFLYTTFSDPRAFLDPVLLKQVRTLVPLLTRSLGDHVARSFTDHRLRQILGYPAVFLATAPDRAPSLYHIMSRLDLLDGVAYPMGGMHTIIDAIERIARDGGAEILTGTEVARVTTSNGRATGVELADGRILSADIVVGACDQHHLETRLLDAGDSSMPAKSWDKRDPGMGALLMMLGVNRRLPGLLHHNLLFTRDWDTNFGDIFGEHPRLPSPASAYVCAPSVSDPGVAPEGCENLFVLVPIPADPTLGPADSGRMKAFGDDIIAQIADWAGIPDLAEHIVVDHRVGPYEFVDIHHAWQGTALGPAHTLRQSAFFRGRVKSRRVDGLYYAGGYTAPGVGLPMCLISAENVIKTLRGDTSGGPMATPLQPR
ncbi:MAG: phytoene desaturase family protein [Arachnia sp.]